MSIAVERIEPPVPQGATRLRFAWVEEWMSMLAGKVLPELARRHDVYYVSAGDEIPKADFVKVIRCKRYRYMNVSGFELSHAVNRLYRDGSIDMAMVWASIGFGLGRVPFINLEGTSVYAEIELFASMTPFYKRPKFLTGLAHYALPEMICNRRAAKTIVPTRALGDDIRRLHGLAPDRIEVVPHGVEHGHLQLHREKPADLRPRLLFVGRLHFRKGLLPVLREFARRRDIDAEFMIAGDGPEREAMQALATRDPRIKLLGNVDRAELASLLRSTNIFVFPTFYEGFGLALTEAMASGHACVSYDIGVVREVLGGTGVLVPLGDAAALVERVARLARDPASIDDYAARAHARAAQFSWEDAPLSIERVMHGVIGTRTE
ncbi:MAG TPA: glycosyltransferase family 4 protein [Burkholderiales bacterium]|nr:glycosyltransferase family 4 protein [Burkholderiales bacterium]